MFIWTQFINELPVGLLAQLVERCTGIAEVMGSNPVRAHKNFFQVPFTTTRFSSVLSCEDLLISSIGCVNAVISIKGRTGCFQVSFQFACAGRVLAFLKHESVFRQASKSC